MKNGFVPKTSEILPKGVWRVGVLKEDVLKMPAGETITWRKASPRYKGKRVQLATGPAFVVQTKDRYLVLTAKYAGDNLEKIAKDTRICRQAESIALETRFAAHFRANPPTKTLRLIKRENNVNS